MTGPQLSRGPLLFCISFCQLCLSLCFLQFSCMTPWQNSGKSTVLVLLSSPRSSILEDTAPSREWVPSCLFLPAAVSGLLKFVNCFEILQDKRFFLSEIFIALFISPLPFLSSSFFSHLDLGSSIVLNVPNSWQHKAYTQISASNPWVVGRLLEYFRTEG